MDFVIEVGFKRSYAELGFRRKLGFYLCVMKPLCSWGFDKNQGFYHHVYEELPF